MYPRTAHEGKVSRWTCIALAASGRRASDDAERVALDLRPFTQLDPPTRAITEGPLLRAPQLGDELRIGDRSSELVL
jgi:hypothetical protein